MYDPALGPTDTHDPTPCPTCTLKQMDCPGHMGHIDLNVPVFNPFLFGDLFKLLRRKCFQCHHFKMRSHDVRVAATKLLLLDVGESRRAMNLDMELKGVDGEELSAEKMREHQEKVLAACAEACARKPPAKRLQTHERQAWRAIMKEFFAAMPNPSRTGPRPPL